MINAAVEIYLFRRLLPDAELREWLRASILFVRIPATAPFSDICIVINSDSSPYLTLYSHRSNL